MGKNEPVWAKSEGGWAKSEGVWAKSDFPGQKVKSAGQKKIYHRRVEHSGHNGPGDEDGTIVGKARRTLRS